MRSYFQLAKSGIVTLVLISVAAGFFMGHIFEQDVDWMLFVYTLIGVLGVAAGASAWNQIQERDLDRTMPRTAKRPLITGTLSVRQAAVFVIASIATGCLFLYWVSPTVLIMGLAAIGFYNGLYTLWWKRKWAFAAVPGAIPGALPVWMGHTAACGDWLDPSGVYLFLLLLYWQMPHFWVLALRYRDDYAAGAIPTLPVSKGSSITVRQIVIWCVGYVVLAFFAPLFVDVEWPYMIVYALTSIALLWTLIRFVRAASKTGSASKEWLRFFMAVNFSLIFYLVGMALDVWSYFYLNLSYFE
jgi:protoheme IX farnesyltransferase